MELDHIVKVLNQLSEEVEKINSSKKIDTSYINYMKIKQIANKYPIKGHVLCENDEFMRNQYMTALISLFLEGGSEDEQNKKLLLIGRILSSFKPEFDYEEYVTKKYKVNLDFWNSFFETIKDKVAVSFAVDALVLCQIEGTLEQRELWLRISEIFQVLKLDKKEIEKISQIAVSILKQDTNFFFQIVDDNKKINYNYFLGYFPKLSFDSISSNIVKAAKLKGKLLIVNAEVRNISKIINIDEFYADEIHFLSCEFINIRGIKSFNKHVIFESCIFNSNQFKISEKKGFWGRNYIECEKDYVFMAGEQIEIRKSKFINCKSSKYLINIKNAYIEDCTFSECLGIELPCTYLIAVSNCKITNTVFEKCSIKTSNDNRSHSVGGVVFVENGEVKNCLFNDCNAHGASSYGSYAKYTMQILRLVNATTIKCSFNNCSCTSEDSSNKIVDSYILAMTNSVSKDNKFVECSSYHYEYSKSRGSHNEGRM